MEKCNPLYWLLNDDDPKAPDWYRPKEKYGIVRELLWLIRNPLHNFTFYVLGVADQIFIRIGKYPEHVFSPYGGWNWGITLVNNNISHDEYWRPVSLRKTLKIILHYMVFNLSIPLPFVSYIGRIKFYAGWRERGNLGFKLTVNRRAK